MGFAVVSSAFVLTHRLCVRKWKFCSSCCQAFGAQCHFSKAVFWWPHFCFGSL